MPVLDLPARCFDHDFYRFRYQHLYQLQVCKFVFNYQYFLLDHVEWLSIITNLSPVYARLHDCSYLHASCSLNIHGL